MSRYRWVLLARACVIVTLGGVEAIHVDSNPYLPVGICVALVGIGVGAYAFTKARGLKQ